MSRDINRKWVDSTGCVFNQHGVDPDWEEKAKDVYDAVVSRDLGQLRYLEKAGLIRGYSEYYGNGGTPLIQCICSFKFHGIHMRPIFLEMVQILLENGANPFTGKKTRHGGVLCIATATGDIDLIRLILSSAFGNMDSVKAWQPDDFETKSSRIVKKNDFVNQNDGEGENPLFIAIHEFGRYNVDSNEIVDLLIKNGADVNAVSNNGRTPLFMCRGPRYSVIIDILIENGANVNAVDAGDLTPLWIHACCLPVVEQLFHHGADVNVRSYCDGTALHVAARQPPPSGVESSIQFLISNGLELEDVDDEGQTPICQAVRCENFESVKELFHAGANLFTKDRDGSTLLHWALTSESITRFLIEHNADIHAVDDHNATPLIVAAQWGTLPTAMLLLEHGASLYCRDDEGNSAYDICTRKYDGFNPIREVVEAENCRRRNEAFAMATDMRLGSDSRANVLDMEVIRMILTGNFM